MIGALLKGLILLMGPGRKELVSYELRGCQAHVWVEVDRGRIKGIDWHPIYGGGKTLYEYFVVERANKSTFLVLADQCQAGTLEMQERTSEDMRGKIVCLK